jgi:hypothetical protein
MSHLETTLDIDAPVGDVWATFLDKQHWKEFSAFEDRSPNHPIVAGGTFRFAIRVLGLPPPPLEVTVVGFEAPSEVRWVGGIPGFPLVQGEHVFRFETLPDRRTRLQNRESFSGALSGLFLCLLGRTFRRAYADFNRGLAARVGGERPAGGTP